MATKQDLITARRRVERVHLPENEMDVCVRAMTGTEADTYQAALEKATAANSTVGLGLLLVSLTLCDEAGKLLLVSPEEAGLIDAKAIARIIEVSLRLSGLTKEFREELEKKVP